MRNSYVILVTGLIFSTSVFAEMTEEQIRQDFKSTKKSVPVYKRVIYPKLEQVIPLQQLKTSPGKSRESHKNVSFLDLLFPSAYAADSIDLRAKDSPIRTQFGGTCTTFGILGALENKLDGKYNFSERHFWNKYQQFSAERAIAIATGPNGTVYNERYWPQNRTSPQMSSPTFKGRVTKQVYLGSSTTKATNKVLQGHPVYVAMSVPQELADCRATLRMTTGVTNGGHAMVIVGYKKDSTVSGGGYYILRNSWGTGCGDKGYQYMPVSLCNKSNMYCYFWSIEGAQKL